MDFLCSAQFSLRSERKKHEEELQEEVGLLCCENGRREAGGT